MAIISVLGAQPVQSDRLVAPIYTCEIPGSRVPQREGLQEVMDTAGGRLMAEWRSMSSGAAF